MQRRRKIQQPPLCQMIADHFGHARQVMAMLEHLHGVDDIEQPLRRRGSDVEMGLIRCDPKAGINQGLAHTAGIAARSEIQQPDSSLTAGQQTGELFAVGVGHAGGDPQRQVGVVVGLFIIGVVDAPAKRLGRPVIAIRGKDKAAILATIIRDHLAAGRKRPWASAVLTGLVEINRSQERRLGVAAFARDGHGHVGRSPGRTNSTGSAGARTRGRFGNRAKSAID